MTKYVFVTGGVVSSLGKGIAAASMAALLESRGVNVTLMKLDPYIRPLYDALFDMTSMEYANNLIEQGIVEIAPLAFMRGRTMNDAFVILDEAQNTTPEQMKMFLTRLGFSSKFVITGDATQRDLVGRSGLDVARQVLGNLEDVAFVDLDRNDIVRHTLVGKIVDAYTAYEKKQLGE